MTTKRVLISGAAGFVGANLAARLSADGHDVHALVHPNSNLWRLSAGPVELARHKVDLLDAAGVERIVAAVRPEWVFHLAAHGAYAWHTDRRRVIDTNVVGTMHLLDACCGHGFDAFVNAGSSSEYGIKDHLASEGDRPEPNSLYAVTKLAATHYCAHMARTTNLHVVTLRLYSVYGPLEEPGRLMPSLVLHGLRGEYPPLANPGSAHDFVYIDDVLEAFMLAARGRAGDDRAIFNVASGVSTSLERLVTLIGGTFGVRAEPRWHSFPDRPWDTALWAGDITRIRARLGWQPRCSLDQGIQAVANWFRENPGMQARYARTEVGPPGSARV